MASQACLTLAPGPLPLLRSDHVFPDGSADLIYAAGEPGCGHQAGMLD